MDRHAIVDELKSDKGKWDLIVIGGGATGLGTALDAASRGLKTLLIEQHDFAKGTSSRSTKLVHGGVRYLRQGNISLVLEALKERGLLLQNAPHIVKSQAFIVPGYGVFDKMFYGIGLKMYDRLAGKLGFGRSTLLSKKQTLEEIPTIEPSGLKGGVRYFDGQFDDSRLAINLMQSIFDHSGVAVNYLKAAGLIKKNGKVSGVKAIDAETGETLHLHARAVVNATGVFTDSIRQMDDPDTPNIIRVSQGVHIVLDKKFQPGDSAIMIPKTEDGRVLFAVPWHQKVIVGTTDTQIEKADLEPQALKNELEFLISHAAKYLTEDPEPSDVRSTFTGLRPLVSTDNDKSTKKLSRDHTILIDPSGLITVTGGKWTTYRRMGEETVNQVLEVANLENRPSQTENMKIHGWSEQLNNTGRYAIYGTGAAGITKIEQEQPGWEEKLHPDLPYTCAEVVWSVRNEMARTVEDVLSRRTRSLLLDARASIESAGKTAELIATERGFGEEWKKKQVGKFEELALNYIMK